MVAVTVAGQPRDYLVEPQAFGGGQVELRDQGEEVERHRAAGAAIQAGLAHTVERLMHRNGYTRRTLARTTRIQPERLGRLLRGERWITLPDVVALGMALEIDLIRYAYPSLPTADSRGEDVIWLEPPGVGQPVTASWDD